MLKVNDTRRVKVTVEFETHDVNTESVVDSVIYMSQLPTCGRLTRVRAIETRVVDYKPELI